MENNRRVPDAFSGQSSPAWSGTAPEARYPALAEDLTCDVCVVGGGIAGLTTAFLLAREGLLVAVLEAGRIGGGESGRSTAHLASVLDGGALGLEKRHGPAKTRLALESHRTAIDFIERWTAESGIACGFERVDGYLFSSAGEDLSTLENEWAAAHRAGAAVSWIPRAPWRSYDTGRCLLFPNQAQLDPVQYLSALAADVAAHGGRVYAGTRVKDATGGKAARVVAENGRTIRAAHIVVATHVPINDWLIMHTKQAAYRSHVIAARVPAGAVPHALGWDTSDPYHYVRVAAGDGAAGGETLLIGGEDHKTGQQADAETPYANLEAWARARFPEIESVTHRWSGQIIETADGLAFIGKNPLDASNVHIATGFAGNGMTYGTIAGMLIADLIQGRPNPWARLYDPRRRTPRAVGAYLKENLNVLPQYLDWLTPGGVKTISEIPAGSGAVVREGMKKIAVYRDPQRGIHACSAVCPHLGGIVNWNSEENTWDCPCHGSRFDPQGQVLNGPANTGLSPVDDERSADREKSGAKTHANGFPAWHGKP